MLTMFNLLVKTSRFNLVPLLPELCSLGKNATFNNWGKWLRQIPTNYFIIIDTKFGSVKARALKKL